MYKVEQLRESDCPECAHCDKAIVFETESTGGMGIRTRWTHAMTSNPYCMNTKHLVRAEPK